MKVAGDIMQKAVLYKVLYTEINSVGKNFPRFF